MNSALVLLTYFAMLLSPCFVAQWGDLLSFRWIAALARRRRTHRAESFLVSFRHERYVMAVALEASFLAAADETHTAPQPFIVPRPLNLNTPAFTAGKQRVAARLAQLAVAQKLRNEAAPVKVVALPADVVAEPVSVHIRPVKRMPEVHAVAAAPALVQAPLVFRDLAELAANLPGGARNAHTPDPVLHSVPERKPGESGEMEIAA